MDQHQVGTNVAAEAPEAAVSDGLKLSGEPTVETSTTRWNHMKKLLPIFALLIALVIIVVVIIVIVRLGNNNEDYEEPTWTVGYSTGVSLITSYAVDATIRSRLSTTSITMEVANALDCSSVHVVTLQLPVDTRVTSLQIKGNDGCTSNGQVQELNEAQDTFEEQVASGLPGAYVEADANDAFSYSVQVSIPPLGTTSVTLVVEQILQQKLGEVNFAIPWIPNENVDKVSFDLDVQDVTEKPAEFQVVLDPEILVQGGDFTRAPTETPSLAPIVVSPPLMNGTTATPTRRPTQAPTFASVWDVTETPTVTPLPTTFTGSLHLELPDARQYKLPKVIRGQYNPGVLPETGLLYADQRCFEHFFVPKDTGEGMARNLFFLLDTSYNVNTQKLREMKAALEAIIDTLTPRDTFVIQTFGRKGTEELWGSAFGTPAEKNEAKEFLKSIKKNTNRGTNLNEALLEGMLRAKTAAANDNDYVTILFVLSSEYASTGETSRSKIAKHVYELNKAQGDDTKTTPVKIFAVGFADTADTQLLDAIALTNGGVSMPLLREVSAKSTNAQQIVDFFSSRIGNILLSDVLVDVYATTTVYGSGMTNKVFGVTQQEFPLVSGGYEVAVRGLVEWFNDTADDFTLTASTTAATLEGINNYEAIVKLPVTSTGVPEGMQGSGGMQNSDEIKSSLCFQSYAHARVSQLMRLYEASKFLDHKIVMDMVTLADPEACVVVDYDNYLSDEENKKRGFKSRVDCLKAEALALALEASLVAKDLTAMVTVPDETCQKLIDNQTEICLDGTSPGYDDDMFSFEEDYYYGSAESDSNYGYRWSSARTQAAGALPFLFVVSLLVAILFG